jgi:hypothetical protein
VFGVAVAAGWSCSGGREPMIVPGKHLFTKNSGHVRVNSPASRAAAGVSMASMWVWR